MKYVISLSLVIFLSFFLSVEAFSWKVACKKATAPVVAPVVCLGKATINVSWKMIKLPVFISKGVLDATEMWAWGG